MSANQPIPAASLLLGACFLFPVATFLLGFLGQHGGVRHAMHLLALAVGLELLVVAAVLVIVGVERATDS